MTTTNLLDLRIVTNVAFFLNVYGKESNSDYLAPQTIVVELILSLFYIFLIWLVAFKYNSLKLCGSRYFGPLISNNFWLVYLINKLIFAIVSVFVAASSLSTINQAYLMIFEWLQVCCQIFAPSFLCFALLFHFTRKTSLHEAGMLMNEMRRVSQTPTHEVAFRSVMIAVPVAALFALFHVEYHTAAFASVAAALNAAALAVFGLEYAIAFALAGLTIRRCNPSKGYSARPRWLLIAALPPLAAASLLFWALRYFLVIQREGEDAPIFAGLSLFDWAAIAGAVTDACFILFVRAENSRIAEKMSQVFIRVQ